MVRLLKAISYMIIYIIFRNILDENILLFKFARDVSGSSDIGLKHFSDSESTLENFDMFEKLFKKVTSSASCEKSF